MEKTEKKRVVEYIFEDPNAQDLLKQTLKELLAGKLLNEAIVCVDYRPLS